MMKYLVLTVLLPTMALADADTLKRLSRQTNTLGSDTLRNAQEVAKKSNETKSRGYKDLTNDLATWEAPIGLQKAFPYYLAGYDDEDRPIWVGEMGKYNLRKVVEEGGENLANLDKYANQVAYRILESFKVKSTPERNITKAMFIADMDGLELIQFASLPTVGLAIRLAWVYRSLIINHLGASIVINTNYIAETLLNIWRPIIGQAAEKIEVYGTNKAKWIPVLRRYFADDVLPEWYGGSKSFKPIAAYG